MKRLIVSLALAVALATNTGCGVLDFLLLGNHGCGPRMGPGCGDECCNDGGYGAGARYRDDCCPCPLDNLFHRVLYGCCSRDGCGCDDCSGGMECGGGHGGCPDDCCSGPLGLGLGGCLRGLWCNLGCCYGGCGECYYGEHRDEPSARCESCDCHGNFTGPGYGSYFPRHRRGHHGDIVETEGEVMYESVPAGTPRRATPIQTRPIPSSPEAYYSPRTTRSAAKFETRPRSKGPHRAYRQVSYDDEPRGAGFTPRHEEESGWQPRVDRGE
jgi:hypothetical protein